MHVFSASLVDVEFVCLLFSVCRLTKVAVPLQSDAVLGNSLRLEERHITLFFCFSPPLEDIRLT